MKLTIIFASAFLFSLAISQPRTVLPVHDASGNIIPNKDATATTHGETIKRKVSMTREQSCSAINHPLHFHLVTTPWFSDENGGHSISLTEPVLGINCSGRYCDNKRLIHLTNGLTNALYGPTHYTHYFSEEGFNQGYCPDGTLMSEMTCSGRFCDNIRLGCREVRPEFSREPDDVKTVGYFSEEQGSGQCPPGYYIYGLACSGRFCDNILLYCNRLFCPE